MIKRIVVAGLMAGILSGCSYVTYKSKDNETLTYFNFGRKYTAQKDANGIRVDAGVDPMTWDVLQQGIEIGKVLGTAGAGL